ncbi:UDP-N-acetylmuramoylalanyl-D-glutamyl-2,6-diaminopimelate--D-alanyl-D-alanine ligase [Lichenihabitans sp. Uapishka_5]|uniref:UDP-N-acetylmuramoylalanyl-D-glutamyl-2, 6-diaminopimelate--D-alanyl-D-alanine ligase n=1 Tax=Lichenihabitans sp. Uapishka_5 TaxID=3037302 RepID=UPI0029E80127|nr:UDP-N-acetylmuramoylalanyl-D-glutamyl-2,6-diaminopimelate--D-alanyl-D-alanine ligase [Lichenihabitans sp. Uapishka_5]MDX7952263.1 UDP-N-acetylmuramoylalanyl-D-glutamyl-2,6-diaminopimelate--D-alanyl-D-alanine ligase [Lichenihabitans sp. Uapishka_5]
MTQALLWSGLDLVTQVQARVRGSVPVGVTGISIDTRTLQPGDLFIAIKGEAQDGHDHVATALDKGAAAAVVDEAHADALAAAGPLYIVHDTLRAMEALGRAARDRVAGRIIAVTGSVGKTSTKEALRTVLSEAGATHASAASYNNHWGVPLTLARMAAATRFGVFEIGMNHAGEITPLVGMVRPHIAIVTTVAPVHLEFFSGVDAIADAKAEIFTGLEPGGLAVINRDDATFERMHAKAEASPARHVLSFGAHQQADARLDTLTPVSDGSLVRATVLGQAVNFHLGAPGRHMAMNALAILIAAKASGLDLEAAAASLGHVAAGQGRGQQSRIPLGAGAFTLIDESYNANPASMQAALALLGATVPGPNGRRIAVLGDMRELGPEAPALHRDLAEPIHANEVDLVFAAGGLMRDLLEALPATRRGGWGDRSDAIQAALFDNLRAGDVVMVKGSNASRMGPLVQALKAHFTPSVAA